MRCPDFRGCTVHKQGVGNGTAKCVLFIEVSLFQGCPGSNIIMCSLLGSVLFRAETHVQHNLPAEQGYYNIYATRYKRIEKCKLLVHRMDYATFIHVYIYIIMCSLLGSVLFRAEKTEAELMQYYRFSINDKLVLHAHAITQLLSGVMCM